MSAVVRPISPAHRAALVELLDELIEFDAEERQVALELIDDAIARPDESGYYALVAELDGAVAGYVCWGPTPMTHGTYDLYWIATAPRFQRRGVARALTAAMDERILPDGARLIRVETSSRTEYDSAQNLYPRLGYDEAARLRDFYSPGDDLVIFMRRLV
ncbi:MAG: GNAT family N-acetyltransferase [Myxococcales bacterium]|nr:GNAT family N-acetyltransferase [Myxococcales bacterium]